MKNDKLVIFSIGPVQSFIAAARKMEDLWSGSYILSHLTSVAIQKSMEYSKKHDLHLELISPYLEEKDFTSEATASLEVASLPNRFTCKVSATNEEVWNLAMEIEMTVKQTFKHLCVEGINKVFNSIEITNDELILQMKTQIDEMIEFYWTCTSLENTTYTKARKTLESRLAAVKNDVQFGQLTQEGLVCTVCHERESLQNIADINKLTITQMRAKAVEFWNHRGNEYKEPRINNDEFLCAVCLAKRTARQLFKEMKAPHTPEVFGKYPAIHEISSPYYAVIMFDGDNMGKWFSRENADIDSDIGYHQALSKKLGHYSMNVVPSIIDKYEGKLIYSGGDDVLAFTSLKNALNVASELREAFANEETGLGEGATLSGAICIAHNKTPLHYILTELRTLEVKSKKFVYGNQTKDAYTLATYTNGEIRHVTMPWYLPNDTTISTTYIEQIVEALNEDLSSTFLYTLAEILQPLLGTKLDKKLTIFKDQYAFQNNELLKVELTRLLGRSKNNYTFNESAFAHILVAIHEVMPNTLNFIHLLEIARFMKQKKEGMVNESTSNAN